MKKSRRIVVGFIIALTIVLIGALSVALYWSRVVGNGSIVFYGQVIDQSGQPIVDADIDADIAVAKLQDLMPSPRGSGLRRVSVHTKSDTDGWFAIRGIEGIRISQIRLSRNGLEEDKISVRMPGDLIYGPWWSDRAMYKADPGAPIVFRVWRNDVSPEIAMWESSGPASSRYKVDLLNPTSMWGGAGHGDIVVSVVANPRDAAPGSIKIRIAADADGGIQEATDLTVAVVPDDGYRQAYDYVIEASSGSPGGLKFYRRYYIVAHGRKIYGKLDFAIRSAPNMPIECRYVINTRGAREIGKWFEPVEVK